MARLEGAMLSDGDWGGIEQITPTTRMGYGQNFIYIEKQVPGTDGSEDSHFGVYNLPHVPAERMADFLVWLADL